MRTLLLLTFTTTGLLAQTPNVLFVIGDDIGVDSVGSYGHPNAAPTPNLDALAAQGVRFTNAHVCPACSPTRAALLTGRHGFRTGIGAPVAGQADGLAASEVVLPEILPANVTSALIGKWHLGADLGANTPTAEGFDVFTGILGGTVPSYYRWPRVRNGNTRLQTTYVTTALVDEAIAFIGGTTAPWFLMLSFNAPHDPYEAPPAGLHSQNLTGLDPQITPIPFYHAMIEAMDAEFGRLLANIPPATLANTTILFLGDNGTARPVTQAPFDPQRSKGSVYQGGVRVPLLAAGHGVAGGGRVEPGLVSAVDFFHTVAALQGVDARAAVPATVPLDGVDFGTLLAGGGQPGVRPTVYSQAFTGTAPMTDNGDAEVVRDERFELLRFQTRNGVREELYDLLNDPWEATDLLQQPLTATAENAYRTLSRELAALRGIPVAIPFGDGCSGAGLTPDLIAIAGAEVGGTFVGRVTGLTPTVTATFGTLGFTADQWLGTALPWDLTGVGMTNCALLVEPVLTRLLPQMPQRATWNVALPNDPGLIGFALYLQAFVAATGSNPAGALATSGLEVLIGN
ncbi:MAG: sulfatase-like hydrolase/transferase [bacterium]|nr:sulfatase-like hydrolase/transferase [bacterium]